MIERYSRPAMKAVWTNQRKLENWLKIELLALESLMEAGIIPERDFQIIKERADFSWDRCLELEKTLNHDVIAFTTNVSENINDDASRWFHYGLTSSDILDTGFALQIKESTEIMVAALEKLREVIAAKAIEHKHTVMIGRSHGIHAEPTTFGLKMALMYDEFGRALNRLKNAGKQASVGKLSGAVGTNAHIGPEVEAKVCEKLGLQPAPLATQVIQRDIHADFIQNLALVAASIERWATEFRHLQRTEVLEAEEYFAKGQKGSSAMPHKRNPITGERLTGLARVIRGNAVAALENVALWHERDISHSSVERVIFPDSCTLLDYMIHKTTQLTEGLIVYPENMKRNMELSLGMWRSQTVLLALIRKGLTREKAYELCQRNAMATWKAKHAGEADVDFQKQLASDEEVGAVLTAEELAELCDVDFHFKNIDYRFKQLGIEP